MERENLFIVTHEGMFVCFFLSILGREEQKISSKKEEQFINFLNKIELILE